MAPADDTMECTGFLGIGERSMDGDLYSARADAARALALTGTASPFTITVRFAGGLTSSQREAFAAAADRWARVVVGDLPDVEVDGEVVDDLLVVAAGEDIGGDAIGIVGPTHVREDGTACRGEMRFDTAALAAMERDGTLLDVVTHEMGHVLGIGTLWDGLVDDPDGDSRYLGRAAMREYDRLTGRGLEPVPVEREYHGGFGAWHWRGGVLGGELMSAAFLVGSPISTLTVASLADLGYRVDLDAAEPYARPESPTTTSALGGHVLRPPRTGAGAWSVGGGGGPMDGGYPAPGSVGGGGGEMGWHDSDGNHDRGVGGGGGHIG